MDNSLSATKENLKDGKKSSIKITFVHELLANGKYEVSEY